MSVSVAGMAGNDHDRVETSSKKRKHTDGERAERRIKKKAKHASMEIDGLSTSVVTERTSGDRRDAESRVQYDLNTKIVPEKDAHGSALVRRVGQDDIGFPDALEQTQNAATQETPIASKKKKRRKTSAEDKTPQTSTTQVEREDIELRDADVEAATSTTLSQFTNDTTSPTQPKTTSDSSRNSPFHTTRASLYVPCPAISLSSALPSLISTHLTPLLLTYYGPLNGLVLSITDASISSRAASEPGKPLLLPFPPSTASSTPATCGDFDGVSFTWLTATFLLFRPQPSSTLNGHINIATEGFIGLVLYNFFQVGISRARIPRDWTWSAPGSSGAKRRKQPQKGRVRDAESVDGAQEPEWVVPDSQATATSSSRGAETTAHSTNTGHWTTSLGEILVDSSPLDFRVVDVDVVPSVTRYSHSLALQIEGTLLSEEEEDEVLQEEKEKFERAQNRAHGRTNSPGSRDQANTMSGALSLASREGRLDMNKQRHRVAY